MNIDQIQELDDGDRFDELFDAAEKDAYSKARDRIMSGQLPPSNQMSTSPYPEYPEFSTPAVYRDMRDEFDNLKAGLIPKQELKPYYEPNLFNKARDVLRENGPIMSALSPLIGLQVQHPDDAPRRIAGAVTELTGHPMAGEAADVATQFIPVVAAVNAIDNGRIPGLLDFTGALNPLKWSRGEKILTAIGGLGDLARRWLDSIPKRDK